MSRDVASLVRAVSGTLLAGPVEDSRIVDAVVRLEDFAVVGHPAYATVVIASAAAAAAVLEAGGSRASELGGTVLVLPEGAEARAVLDRSGATGILAPDSTPRILIAELAAILAADQASEDRGVTTGTKVLTQVARRGGARAVVAELASRIDGWAVLLDDHGQVLHTSGAGSLHIADASAVAFNRPVRVRHPGLQVHPVGLGEDLLAYLVVSSRSGRVSTHRDLAAQAAALLDLILRRHDHSGTERLGREIMLRAILRGGDDARSLLRRWNVLDTRLVAFVLTSRSRSVVLESLLRGWLDDLGAPHLFAMDQEAAVGLIRPEAVGALARRTEEFGTPPRPALRLGLGTAHPVDALGPSADEAHDAHDAAIAGGHTVSNYDRLPSVRFVLQRMEPADIGRLASLLDPLREHPQGDELLAALRAYLVAGGTWSEAARTLGVHRQTLMHRIAAVEELTGWDLGDIEARTGAWLALRALGS